jgi:hypothetical protein
MKSAHLLQLIQAHFVAFNLKTGARKSNYKKLTVG